VTDPVTVVIVHWNQPERCVRTAGLLRDQGVAVRLLVVDNASEPAALAAVEAGIPDAEVVALDHNAGFGPAANAGLRRWLDRGEGELVAVVPHDALPEPGCLERLVDAMLERPRAGLASAEYGEPGKPVVDRFFGGILVPSERRPGWEDAGHPHGTLLVARRACLADIGLFDERYFAYCEEADLGERARRAGWEVGVVWGAVVRNPSWSVGSAVAEYLMLRNSLLLVRHHFGRYPVFIRLVMAVGDLALRAVRPATRPPVFSPRARLMAMADFLRGRFGPPPDLVTAANR
jgi:GT2 family glycosyltransferase